MKNILCLCIYMLCAGCATTPTQPGAQPEKPLASKAAALPDLTQLKIGMSRTEAEHILGEPTSVTERATGVTAIWVFESAVSPTARQNVSQNNGELIGKMGTVAATAAGMVSPIAGAVTSIGSQIYNAGAVAEPTATKPKQTENDHALIVTLEFREDKVFSIQRARPSATLSTYPK